MRNKKREKLQRQVNKKVRNMNLNIREDPLWKGRYFSRQIRANFHDFEDGSGVVMNFTLRFFDRKTKNIKDYSFHTFTDGVDWLNWDFFEAMNEFIIKSGVWEENPRPTYENSPNYRKEHF